jgi:hypothetical protein
MEKNNVTFLKLFINAMKLLILKLKIFKIILKFQNLWNLINVFIIENNYENVYISISYDFSKFNGFTKIKVMPPKNGLAP